MKDRDGRARENSPLPKEIVTALSTVFPDNQSGIVNLSYCTKCLGSQSSAPYYPAGWPYKLQRFPAGP